jgi:hypothetical protein
MLSFYAIDTLSIQQIKTDKYGNRVQTETEVKGKVDNKARQITSQDGRQIVANMTVFLDNSIQVVPGDKIAIKKRNGIDYKETKYYNVSSVNSFYGMSGTYKEAICI